MISANFDKGGKFSSWLLSLMIVLTMLGFSGSLTQPVAQNQKHAEVQLRTTDRSKIRPSFNRLRSGLISRNFFDRLGQTDATRFECQLKPVLVTAFDQASHISDSLITFAEVIRFRYRARSFDNGIVLQG